VSFDEGRKIKEADDHNEELTKMRTSECFAVDGSKWKTDHS
jgi:hypothetical protein